MEFIFEVHVNKNLDIIKKEDLNRLRKLMATFEVISNTVIPEVRVRLTEK